MANTFRNALLLMIMCAAIFVSLRFYQNRNQQILAIEWQIVNKELQRSLLNPTAPNTIEGILGHPPYILTVERPFGIKEDGQYIYSCIYARVNYLTQPDIGRPVEYKLLIEHNLSENKVKVTRLDFGVSKLVRTPCAIY